MQALLQRWYQAGKQCSRLEQIFSWLLTALIALLLLHSFLGLFEPRSPYDIESGASGYSLDLHDYALVHHRQISMPLENASGLTYNAESKTLFMVLNRPEAIIELSLTGEVLRKIILRGFDDTEAISWIEGKQFIIAEEEHRQLQLVAIDEATLVIDKVEARTFVFPDHRRNNKGIEGVTFNRHTGQVYVALESKPMTVFNRTLFGGAASSQFAPLMHLPADSQSLIDLSGLQYVEKNGTCSCSAINPAG